MTNTLDTRILQALDVARKYESESYPISNKDLDVEEGGAYVYEVLKQISARGSENPIETAKAIFNQHYPKLNETSRIMLEHMIDYGIGEYNSARGNQ